MTIEDPNYKYWRENGGGWADEYQNRKQRFPLYHIQEIMLAEYMAAHADVHRPIKVIEFGCGVGRHLRNLVRIAGLDVYGFDQSPTMLSGCSAWADDAWFASHVTLGAPVGRLPYADDSFDIVYSTEVLVHVRPEHLPGVLSELLRIARGHVLHLEPAPGIKIHSDVHSGCWGHDLQSAYKSLGFTCEVFDGGYSAHAPYRVVKSDKPRFTWEPWRLEMYRACERMLTAGFESSDVARQTAESETSAARDECAALKTSLADSQSREVTLQGRLTTLEAECGSANRELERLRAQSSVELSLCRAEAASRAEEAAQRHRTQLDSERQTAQATLAAAQTAFEIELNRIKQEARESEDRQRAHFEPLLDVASHKLERAESEIAGLRRDLQTTRLMREDLSIRVVSQQSRIDELADTLRRLYLNHELFTASVKSIVDPKEKPIP